MTTYLGAGGEAGAHAPEEPPPSAASTIGLMGAGAVGALAVAAVGVYGVLQMSLLVASSTGRSLSKDTQDSKGASYTAERGRSEELAQQRASRA